MHPRQLMVRKTRGRWRRTGKAGAIGAASGNRTPDNLITSEVLYRLS